VGPTVTSRDGMPYGPIGEGHQTLVLDNSPEGNCGTPRRGAAPNWHQIGCGLSGVVDLFLREHLGGGRGFGGFGGAAIPNCRRPWLCNPTRSRARVQRRGGPASSSTRSARLPTTREIRNRQWADNGSIMCLQLGSLTPAKGVTWATSRPGHEVDEDRPKHGYPPAPRCRRDEPGGRRLLPRAYTPPRRRPAPRVLGNQDA